MMTIKDAEELKKNITESIRMLKASLYDDKGNLYDASLFGGGEADRQNKLNLLNDYQEQLKKINNSEPIYGNVLLLKKKELSSQEKIEIENKRKNMMLLNFMEFKCPSVYSYMQYPDGNYHDTYVFYKGHSDKYDIDFICYYDNTVSSWGVTPVEIKDGQLMKNPKHTQEMISDIAKQPLEQFKQGNFLKFEQLSQEIPSVMGNTDVDQYESVPCEVIIGHNIPPKTQTQTKASPLPPQPSKKNDGYRNNSMMYHYYLNGANFPNGYEKKFKSLEDSLASIKQNNPDIEIVIERFKNFNLDRHGKCRKCTDTIVSISKRIELFDNPKFKMYKSISEGEYRELVDIMDSNEALNYMIYEYPRELGRYLGVNIVKNCSKYRKLIVDTNKVSEIHDFEKYICARSYREEKNIIFTGENRSINIDETECRYEFKFETFVRYRCNQLGKFIEERPYAIDNVRQNTGNSSSKDTMRNNSSDLTISEELNKNQDLKDSIDKIQESLHQNALNQQHLINLQREEISLLQQQVTMLQQQVEFLQSQLPNQITMNGNTGRSI